MDTKISQLLQLMRDQRWNDAILFAAKFPRLGDHAAPIQRAREAINRPDFMRQCGRDPDALIRAGIDALRARYDVTGARRG